MFVRVKSTPNSPRQSVQIVQSVRIGDKVKQKIVRYVGIAMDDDELAQLKVLAEVVKAKIEAQHQSSLFPPETVAKQMIEAKAAKAQAAKAQASKATLNVDLMQMVEEQRVVLGIHEVYGEVYRQLSFDTLLSQKRYRASHEAQHQSSLFPPETVAKQMIEAKAAKAQASKATLNVDLMQMVEEQRVVLGIHEVYGEVYRQLSFDTLLSQKRYRASHEALFHCVMVRIANPPRARQAQARQRAAPGAELMRFFVIRESLSDDGSAGR